MKAIVVGGGIGGLATAVSLRRVGWEVVVYERAAEFGEIGAGVGVMPNALRALEWMGLADEVRRLGTPRVSGGVRASDGRWLAHLPDVGQEKVIAMHRADLHGVLLRALPSEILFNNVEVTGVEELDADLVVAADGINSRLRAELLPDARDRCTRGPRRGEGWRRVPTTCRSRRHSVPAARRGSCRWGTAGSAGTSPPSRRRRPRWTRRSCSPAGTTRFRSWWRRPPT
ncbi:FAD-dependent oxidoreductase [Lentzea indica]|uniref:FAD-dependent oxidoreductase n=1 Tax=Lentzea indica TaxID=2604800 RepID=UPI001FE48D32|nr:FAD-dependent monooxygenase [Lentzea indica]